MSATLGKMEKPEAKDFTSKRKLYLVPLIFSGKDAPPDYHEKFTRYWAEVSQHIANLEEKLGKVSHVYHEVVYQAGEEGLKAVEKLNPASHRIAKEKTGNGAVFEATEQREVAEECMDWERFILIGFLSQKVADLVSELYTDAVRKRYEHIARAIDQTLKGGESGLLFIREGHMVQFPRDIEVFSVAPPALDDIHRWQRERAAKPQEDRP